MISSARGANHYAEDRENHEGRDTRANLNETCGVTHIDHHVRSINRRKSAFLQPLIDCKHCQKKNLPNLLMIMKY